MNITFLSIAVWGEIISLIILASMVYRYRHGLREVLVKVLKKRIWFYLIPVYVVGIFLIVALFFIEDSLNWPMSEILFITIFVTMCAFLLIEVRPESKRSHKK